MFSQVCVCSREWVGMSSVMTTMCHQQGWSIFGWGVWVCPEGVGIPEGDEYVQEWVGGLASQVPWYTHPCPHQDWHLVAATKTRAVLAILLECFVVVLFTTVAVKHPLESYRSSWIQPNLLEMRYIHPTIWLWDWLAMVVGLFQRKIQG